MNISKQKIIFFPLQLECDINKKNKNEDAIFKSHIHMSVSYATYLSKYSPSRKMLVSCTCILHFSCFTSHISEIMELVKVRKNSDETNYKI